MLNIPKTTLSVILAILWVASFEIASAATFNSSGPASYYTGGLRNGLVGWWTMDGTDMAGTNVYDKSGNGYTGISTGDVTKTTGKLGQALKFYGSGDYVVVTDNDALTPAKLTISAWIKPSSLVADKVYFGKGGEFWIYYQAAGVNCDGAPVFNFIYQSSGTTWKCANGTTTPATNRWYHVVGIFDGSTIKIYVNGIQEGSATSVLATNNSSWNLTIGGWINVGYDQAGTVDDARIYNRALSASEIKQLYQTGASAVMGSNMQSGKSYATGELNSGLVNYWTFDATDVSGTQVYDKIANNTGAISGGAARAIGKLGQAMNFDGTGYINTNTNTVTSGPLTLAFWVKPTSNVSAQYFVSTRDPSDGKGGFWIQRSQDSPFSFYVDSDTTHYSVPSAQTYSVGSWYYLVGTYDPSLPAGERIKIYVNGSFSAQNTGPDALGTPATLVTIGRNVGGSYNTYGSIDDVRIYSRALSATEIKQLYQMGASIVAGSDMQSGKSYATGGLKSGLVGHWTMDAMDVAGTQVYDKSGQNNTGTSSGGLTKSIGKLGQAMRFNGTSGKIESSTITGWSNTAISIAFWAKQLAAPANYTQVVGDKSSMGAVYVFPSTGQFFGQLGLVSAGTVQSGYVAPGTSWNHWVFTWQSGDRLKLYKNGILASQSVSAYTDTITAFTGINIGFYVAAPDYFNGYIDDARVYNRALSPAEIQQLYQMGK